MNIEDYNQICKICDDILLDNRSNETTISIPLLHVVRDHPIFLNQYDSLFRLNFNKTKVNYKHYFIQFISLILSFLKASLVKKKYWVSSNKLMKSYDFIFVSHLLNEEQAGNNKDFYYDFIPKDLSNMGYKVLVVLLNHTSITNENLINKWGENDVTRLILSKQTGLFNEIQFHFNFLIESVRLKKLYINQTDDLQSKIVKLAINQVRPSINNLQLALQFRNISKKLNPKNVIITYEGHAWERLAFKNFRKYSKTKCFAYQHALIFKNQYAIKRNLLKEFNPDIILTSGEIGMNILKNSSNLFNIEIDILGSNRAITDKLNIQFNNNNKSILVLPEATIEECLLLFEHSFKCAESLPDVKFIWRLHPLMKFNALNSKIIKFDSIPKNIKLSNSSLNEDINECNFVLYRGTTAVINCVMSGLRPIYLQNNDIFIIDPLYEINEFKHIVKEPIDTINFIDSFTYINEVKLENNCILKQHASKLFTTIEIDKILKYKNTTPNILFS